MTSFLSRLFEPKRQIAEEKKFFSNRDLKNLIFPLFIEQGLVMLVGLADSMMVSYAGESAVSAVSLVDMFNTIFIYVFTALAAGGAVVVSQYIGSGDKKNGNLASSQIFTITALVSIVMTAVVFLFNRNILGLLYGSTAPEVMEASVKYLSITSVSYPALALYSAGAAIYRSMSKTKVTMKVSIGMNLINVVGNAIGIFALQAGVAGVAWPTTISRVFAAVVMTALCFQKANPVSISWKNLLQINGGMIKRLLRIAVPNGIENGLFQVAKVALSTITALFGTSQIAANGVGQTFWSMAALIGVAFGPAFITVVGQAMGKGDAEIAEYYMNKLLRITLVFSVIWNAFILVLTPLALTLYDLPEGTKQLILILVLIHNVFNAFAFPFSGCLSNGLRAAGDVKFTMYSAIFSTVVCRVALSVIFAIWLDLGVIGIALAMAGDWCIKAVMTLVRYKNGKWKSFKVI